MGIMPAEKVHGFETSDNPLGNWVIKKYEELKADRTNWDSYWDELSYYIIPKKNNVYGSRQAGDRASQDVLFDSTSIHSNELLAAALHSMLTNPSTVWFGLSTGNADMDKDDEVRKWTDIVVHKMINVFNNSNFQTEVHEMYLDMGCFGASTLLIEDDDETVLRFRSNPIYQHYIDENNKGIVDTVFRQYKWTARQIIMEFGEKNVPDYIIQHDKIVGSQTKFDIIQGVGPRTKRDPKKLNPQNKPFYSCHVLVQSRHVLRNSGFDIMPFIVPRWSKVSGEVYGRSPGMKALADIKMVNALMKITLQAGQLSVAPPLQAPDDGILMPIKTMPHAINIYRAGSKDRIEPLNTGVDPKLGEDMMEQTRMRIRSAFFIDQLQLGENNPQMTATEVLQRTEEKLRMLGPILGRQHFEFLQPLIERCFIALSNKGYLPPPPKKMQTNQLNIKYTSQLAKAQKAAEGDAFTRVMQILSPLAGTHPEMLDNINTDEVVRFAADIFTLPPNIIRDKSEVEGMRQQRQEVAAQQAQMAQQEASASALQKGAAGAKSIAEAQGAQMGM